MENIAITGNIATNQFSIIKQLVTKEDGEQESSSNSSEASKPEASIYLQPDIMTISKEALEKKSVEELSTEEASTEKSRVEESDSSVTKNNLGNVFKNDNEGLSSELDKEIEKLGVKILEVSIQVEVLKAKGDDASTKESRSLEVELAMLRGLLEAKMKQKLSDPSSALIK